MSEDQFTNTERDAGRFEAYSGRDHAEPEFDEYDPSDPSLGDEPRHRVPAEGDLMEALQRSLDQVERTRK